MEIYIYFVSRQYFTCVTNVKFILQVGGEISSVIMYQMKPQGRVAVVGSISTYNADAKTLPKGT